MMPTVYTDQELIDHCLQGNEEAWSALSDLIKRLTGGLAATRWLETGAQEEIVQEALTTLLHDQRRALRQFAGRSLLSTYLAVIVLRVAARLRRERGHSVLSESGLVEELSRVADRQMSHVEMWAVIEQALSSTDVLILRLDAAGYNSDEVAGMLSRLHNRPWAAAAVRQRKSRALRRLRRVLSES